MFRITLITLIIFLAGASASAGDKWYNRSFFKKGSNYHYVGVSSASSDLQKARRDAYNDAVSEAIKHNFGFNQTLLQNIYGTVEETTLQEESFVKAENVQVSGVIPGRIAEIEKSGKITVYREIIYPYHEISKEKARLRAISKKMNVTNHYSKGSGVKGTYAVITIPALAQAVFTPIDTRISAVGTTNAKFSLPMGRYSLSVSKDGYKPEIRRVVVTPEEGDKSVIILRPVTGTLNIKVYPEDAAIYIDSKEVKAGEIELRAKRTYKLRVEHRDYYSESQDIEVFEKKELRIVKRLKPRASSLTIYSSPSEAKVYANKQYIGRTPLINHEVEAGKIKLLVKKSGFESADETIYAQQTEDIGL